MKCLKALIADVPYSNKKLACMDMEERYCLILSTIFNAIGCRVEVEKMIATGRIDIFFPLLASCQTMSVLST